MLNSFLWADHIDNMLREHFKVDPFFLSKI